MKKKCKHHKARPTSNSKVEATSCGDFQKRGRHIGYGSLAATALAIWVSHQQGASRSTNISPSKTTSTLRRLLKQHCRNPTEFCSDVIEVDGRELKVKNAIPPNTQLFTISRSSQIWDIDALRSPLIQNLNLLEARHANSNLPLTNVAYLAAYISLRNRDDMYLQYLPSYDDFKEFHPMAMDEDYLEERLGGKHSYTFQLILVMKRKIQSEYEAFCNASQQFKNLVSQEIYMESRINVMSRSFNIPQTNVELTSEEQLAFQHLDTANTQSMVPLLDALDHQYPGNNILWGRLSPESGDIGVMSTQQINRGQVILNKYGTREPQEYMFAIYGFLLGSEPLSRSLNTYHRVVEPGIESTVGWQQLQLLHYLVHDDGYPHCIEPEEHPTEFAFKRIKLQVLEMIANSPRYWVIRLPSRRNNPPQFDSDVPDHDFDTILQTCRLLAMTHVDYQGSAQHVLLNALSQGTLQPLQVDSDVLELRAWTWLHRLARLERNKYNVSMTDLKERISHLESTSKEWTFAQLQYGEIQALEFVMERALAAEKLYRKELRDVALIRDEACPLSTVQPLLAQMGYDSII